MLPEYDFNQGVRGSQQQKYFLSLAGEFYVAAELHRRGIYASVTYGAAKNADVLVFDQSTGQTAVVEVKTTASPNQKWLTGAHSLNKESVQPHIFWVLVLLPAENTLGSPRYFVMSSEELVQEASARFQQYSQKYQEKHGVSYPPEKGVHGLTLSDVEALQCEDQWSKITNWLQRK